MNLEQLESKLLALPRDERRAFAEWFYNHESEFYEVDEREELPEPVRRELIRRRDEIRANPALATPVTDEYFERLRKKISDARAANASAC